MLIKAACREFLSHLSGDEVDLGFKVLILVFLSHLSGDEESAKHRSAR